MYLQPPDEPPETNESSGIPDFDHRGLLPPGIHTANWPEVVARFGWPPRRRDLLTGLQDACRYLKQAGVDILFLNGSFVSNIPVPGDYDACWDMGAQGLALACLPGCLHPDSLSPPEQKDRFQGEFYSLEVLAPVPNQRQRPASQRRCGPCPFNGES